MQYFDLGPWAQGQALRVLLSQKCNLLLFNCQKYAFDLDQTCQKLHRQVAHHLIKL